MHKENLSVFISHKSDDKSIAHKIANHLKACNVCCYLDALDQDLQTTEDITSLLVSRVRENSHLMAVTSTRTVSSWWVPFEIGIATDRDKRIYTYALERTNLPEYLQKWPILENDVHLEEFIKLFHFEERFSFDSNLRAGIRASALSPAENFHKLLKIFTNNF